MLSKEFKDVIKLICSGIKDKRIKWALVGSTNMYLQGINVDPNDLDITTNINSLKIFEKEFNEHIIKPISKNIKKKYSFKTNELKLLIKGIEVQIIGEHDNGVYFENINKGNIVLVGLDNIKIPCLSLSSEADAYSKTGRNNKADLIINFLTKIK